MSEEPPLTNREILHSFQDIRERINEVFNVSKSTHKQTTLTNGRVTQAEKDLIRIEAENKTSLALLATEIKGDRKAFYSALTVITVLVIPMIVYIFNQAITRNSEIQSQVREIVRSELDKTVVEGIK